MPHESQPWLLSLLFWSTFVLCVWDPPFAMGWDESHGIQMSKEVLGWHLPSRWHPSYFFSYKIFWLQNRNCNFVVIIVTIFSMFPYTQIELAIDSFCPLFIPYPSSVRCLSMAVTLHELWEISAYFSKVIASCSAYRRSWKTTDPASLEKACNNKKQSVAY